MLPDEPIVILIVKYAAALLLPFVAASLILWATSKHRWWNRGTSRMSIREFNPFVVRALLIVGLLITASSLFYAIGNTVKMHDLTVKDVGNQVTSVVTGYQAKKTTVETESGAYLVGDYETQPLPLVGDSITVYCHESNEYCWINGELSVGFEIESIDPFFVFLFFGGVLLAATAARIIGWDYEYDKEYFKSTSSDRSLL